MDIPGEPSMIVLRAVASLIAAVLLMVTTACGAAKDDQTTEGSARITPSPQPASPVSCGHYEGENPSFEQFRADVAEYWDAYLAVVRELAPPTSGAREVTGNEMADSHITDEVAQRFASMPDGAAAEITTWLCEVTTELTDEQLRQSNLTRERNAELRSHIRGQSLLNALLEVDCQGGPPDAMLNVTVSAEEAAEKLRQTLC